MQKKTQRILKLFIQDSHTHNLMALSMLLQRYKKLPDVLDDVDVNVYEFVKRNKQTVVGMGLKSLQTDSSVLKNFTGVLVERLADCSSDV